ncbi:hypothetical protein VTO42DRAFT_2171 [Malbranchea cinnamomea]
MRSSGLTSFGAQISQYVKTLFQLGNCGSSEECKRNGCSQKLVLGSASFTKEQAYLRSSVTETRGNIVACTSLEDKTFFFPVRVAYQRRGFHWRVFTLRTTVCKAHVRYLTISARRFQFMQ